MKLSYRSKKKLPKSAFALPAKRKYPITDKRHARAALSRAAQKKSGLSKAERCKVVAAVCSRYPDVGVCAGESSSKKLNSCPIPKRYRRRK